MRNDQEAGVLEFMPIVGIAAGGLSRICSQGKH
jgi:hypothetical protein